MSVEDSRESDVGVDLCGVVVLTAERAGSSSSSLVQAQTFASIYLCEILIFSIPDCLENEPLLPSTPVIRHPRCIAWTLSIYLPSAPTPTRQYSTQRRGNGACRKFDIHTTGAVPRSLTRPTPGLPHRPPAPASIQRTTDSTRMSFLPHSDAVPFSSAPHRRHTATPGFHPSRSSFIHRT